MNKRIEIEQISRLLKLSTEEVLKKTDTEIDVLAAKYFGTFIIQGNAGVGKRTFIVQRGIMVLADVISSYEDDTGETFYALDEPINHGWIEMELLNLRGALSAMNTWHSYFEHSKKNPNAITAITKPFKNINDYREFEIGNIAKSATNLSREERESFRTFLRNKYITGNKKKQYQDWFHYSDIQVP